MSLAGKLPALALSGVQPTASVSKQSAADLQKDSVALTAQLLALQQKVDVLTDAASTYDSTLRAHTFASREGSGTSGNAILKLTKATGDGEGVNWTLRLTPSAANLVLEATVSVGVASGMRVFGGSIADFAGYEAFSAIAAF